MGLILTILVVLVILVILWIVIGWFFKSSTNLTSMSDATKGQKIDASELPSNDNTSNYTYSTWFYVNDWNYKFGTPKVLLSRLDQDGHPSPSIVLGAIENNITVSVACYPQSQSTGTTSNTSIVHKCEVQNFPLQKWVNLIISLYGRTLDIYIDGKLFRTCVLPGVAKVATDTAIHVTPSGGFDGFTSNFQYWADSTNPQEAYNIYKSGYGGSVLGNLFNKYRIRIEFLEDNQVEGSFEI